VESVAVVVVVVVAAVRVLLQALKLVLELIAAFVVPAAGVVLVESLVGAGVVLVESLEGAGVVLVESLVRVALLVLTFEAVLVVLVAKAVLAV
jgi:hypothetical protein